MANQNYSKIDEKKIALAAGIIGGILMLLTTINGIYEISNTANFIALSSMGLLGYNVGWRGALVGTALGFVYAFVTIWITAKIYNKLIS